MEASQPAIGAQLPLWRPTHWSKVQTQFLDTLTAEVNENAEELLDGEFLLNEFVDRFGPRLAHLNGVIQVLAQVGAARRILRIILDLVARQAQGKCR